MKDNKTVVTNKGTVLPLLNLRGSDYMQVMWRIVWFVEENPYYRTSIEFLNLDENNATAKVTILVLDSIGNVIRKVEDIKTESKGDFKDFAEKAVTGAMGRALSQLGYGTSYALADLDEGSRIVDSPAPSPTGDVKLESKVLKGTFNQDLKKDSGSDW